MVVDVDIDVIDPVIVAVHMNGNDTVVVIRPVDGLRNRARTPVDTPTMLSFQKLDVYQRSIEFLAFARRLLNTLPEAMATSSISFGEPRNRLRRTSRKGQGRPPAPTRRNTTRSREARRWSAPRIWT